MTSAAVESTGRGCVLLINVGGIDPSMGCLDWEGCGVVPSVCDVSSFVGVGLASDEDTTSGIDSVDGCI